MNGMIKQLTALVLIWGAVITGATSCSVESTDSPFDTSSIESYKDIPGVTDEEITAIEALKSERQSFSFGTLPTTEAFILQDGTHSGFTTKFCDLLSGLFDIPFVQEFHSWDSLKSGIDSGAIDFTGELSPSSDQKQFYSMTYPIAERSLCVFTYGNSVKIENESDLNGLRVGFFNGTAIAQSIHDVYPALSFEPVVIEDTPDAVEMITSGKIDAFIIYSVESYTFAAYPLIHSKELFPLVYSPVSLATRRPELKPVISVMDKYIAAGGVDKLYDLYKEGKREYAKYEFNLSLTDEERGYLDGLAANGSRVPTALEKGNYPICFYNEKEKEFQGIAPDLLKEISKLTDITFDVANDKNTSWGTMLEMLRTGKVSLVSQLLYSEKREGNFLWSEPYASSHCALLSKTDYPSLEMYQVVQATVGIVKESAYEELYNKWFPNNSNVKYYNSMDEALDALERGEIELLMASENVLLALTNYREKSGYKINILFSTPIEESFLGFRNNEQLLCSIISKAQHYIDANKIEKDWTSRTYDYSRKLANVRALYFSIFTAVLLLALIIMIILYFRNNNTRKLYKNQMITLSTMYKALPDLVYSKDVNCKYTSCNDSFEEFIGMPESEIIGRTVSEAYTADMIMAYKLMAMDRKVIKEHSIAKAEGWLRYPDLSRRLFEIIKVPLIHEGKIVGVLGINRDITKYRDAERAAQEASRAKSNFLAKMSHEIRTPMNAIIGMTELALRDTELDAAQKNILTVKQAGAHLLSIINDILDFSKIEMGKLEILPADYSFSSLINDIISIIRMRVIDSQIRFAVNIDSNIPNALIGDETRLRQVLLNILNNAVKYTEKGFVSFTVTGELTDDDNINLSIEVMDSGKGIKQEDIKNLFGEYVQVDVESNKGIEGVGLGLAITWNIVKAMGGDIKIYSEYGKGSIFTVTLPQKIRSREILAKVEKPEETSAIVYERREIYANSITCTIDNLGVKCTLVSNDSEFYEKMADWPYSFIFISYGLMEKNKNTILKFGANAKIIILSEFGESIPDKKMNILAMPVYSISIANVFNGISDSFNYSENSEHIVRFTAPAARVLIVDDINTNLKVADGLMLPYKMQVDLCQSGKESIEAVKLNHYDLIFMDHKMPEMDGVTATSYIRTLDDKDPYYKNVPIVVLTANAVAGTREMFLHSGFNDFLSKPIDTVKLNTILEKWIPKEKQKNITYNDAQIVKEQDISMGIEIEGIDIKRGIFLSGGTIDLYLETLAIFYKDGLKKMNEIKSSLGTGNLSLFTIYIHSMKSASANVGAGELSEAAKALEMAGEQNNSDFIRTNIDEFLSALELLLRNVNNVLTEHKGNAEGGENTYDITQLKSEFIKLKEALNSLDAGTINKTVDNLRTITQSEGIKALVQTISEKILICEYEEAIELIEVFLQEKQ